MSFINSVNSQIKGVDFENALIVSTEAEIQNNKRVLLKNEDGTFIFFGKPTSAVAVQRAIEKTTEICEANNIKFDSPFEDKTIIDKERVRDIYDYKELAHSLLMENSEVDQLYLVNEESFKLFMSNEGILIVFNLKE